MDIDLQPFFKSAYAHMCAVHDLESSVLYAQTPHGFPFTPVSGD